MSVFTLCDQAIGLVRGKRLILSSTEKTLLESLDYEGLANAHSQDEAVVCAMHFARVRDGLLQAFPWIFARKTETPAQLSESVPGWRYTFLIPSDSLKVLSVLAADNRVPFYEAQGKDLSEPPEFNELVEFEEADGKLYTNRTPVHIRYTGKVTGVDDWAALFANAFVIKLAEAISPAVGASADLIQVLEKDFEQTIQTATANGVIKADTGLPRQRETRPVNDYRFYGYSGLTEGSVYRCG